MSFNETMNQLILITICVFLFPIPDVYAAASAVPNEAFFISPMELQISPDGSAPVTLEVFNHQDHEIPIHIDIFARSEDADGSEKRRLSKEITVSSADFKLSAGESRKLELRYSGPKKISNERAYRVVVRQIGTQDSESLDVRFVYVASLYVTPKSVEPNLIVQKVRRASEIEIETSLTNSGSAHAELAQYKMSLLQQNPDGKIRELALSSETQQKISKINLLAGSRRQLKMQIADGEKIAPHAELTVKVLKVSTVKAP